MNPNATFAAVILAAGEGTRMKSKRAKVLLPVAGKPMVEYAVEAAAGAGVERTVLVIGYQGEQIRERLGARVAYAEQPIRRGTGDAVRCAQPLLEGRVGQVLVFYADMPLLRQETLDRLVRRHRESGATLSMLTVVADETMNFGRIIRDSKGRAVSIVEEVEATPEQQAIKEINPGVSCFRADWLWTNLGKLQPSPKKSEFYLTDLLTLAVAQGERVETETIYEVSEAQGINTRVQLAAAERLLRERIRERIMLGGVTLEDPASIYIDADVTIGQDTVIRAQTHLLGTTQIGDDCEIGPGAVIRDTAIGDRCKIGGSVLESAQVADDVIIGPFCHLRAGAFLERKVRLGNYAEVKNSRLGEGVHMGHFSYMGDADVGAHTNIGAGTITCNYDGVKKHKTVIGEDVFIGSDSMLVAPLTIGARARTGAGSVVTKDVPEDALAVGVPARVIRRNAGGLKG